PIYVSGTDLPPSVVIFFGTDLDEKFHVAFRNIDFSGQGFCVCSVMRESNARDVFDHTEILTDAVFVPIRQSSDRQKRHQHCEKTQRAAHGSTPHLPCVLNAPLAQIVVKGMHILRGPACGGLRPTWRSYLSY